MDRCGVVVMTPLLTLLLLLSGRSAMGAPRYRERWEQEGPEWRPDEEGKGGKGLFLLDNVEKVVDSEGGQVHVVRGPFVPEQPWQQYGACREGLMHIGFITMEPKTLFVPQYIDSNLILFVQRGA